MGFSQFSCSAELVYELWNSPITDVCDSQNGFRLKS